MAPPKRQRKQSFPHDYVWRCCGRDFALPGWHGHFERSEVGPDLDAHEWEGIFHKETGELLSEDPWYKPSKLTDENLGVDLGPPMVYGRVKPQWFDHHPIIYFFWFMIMQKKPPSERIGFGEWVGRCIYRYLAGLPNEEPMSLYDFMDDHDYFNLLAVVSGHDARAVAEAAKVARESDGKGH